MFIWKKRKKGENKMIGEGKEKKEWKVLDLINSINIIPNLIIFELEYLEKN